MFELDTVVDVFEDLGFDMVLLLDTVLLLDMVPLLIFLEVL